MKCQYQFSDEDGMIYCEQAATHRLLLNGVPARHSQSCKFHAEMIVDDYASLADRGYVWTMEAIQ